MEQDFRIRLLEWGTHGLKIIGALAVGFLFLSMLMVATAQQQVVAHLQEKNIPGGYSGARVILQSAEGKVGDYKKLKALLVALQAKDAAQEQTVTKLDQRMGEATFPLMQEYEQIASRGFCDTVNPRAVKDFRLNVPEQIAECVPPASRPDFALLLKTAQDDAHAFIRIRGDYYDADQVLEGLDAQTKLVGTKVDAGVGLTPDEKNVRDIFGDINSAGLVVGPMVSLATLSPPLLQLLMTFAAGMFGALLVTLVLIVYPANKIVTMDDARPVTRTFLGGLIALCVYIVLLGGTAVLGSSSANNSAGNNYMAFAGIGILAGMFSDRVAGWLSKRADEFFTQ